MSAAGRQLKFNAIIADRDMAARIRLKSATTSVPLFGVVRVYSALDEVAAALNEPAPADVIFIANRFPRPEIISFIAESKRKPSGQDAAYVMLLDANNQEASGIAQNVLDGADGFLLEPYSVNHLVEITQLAAKVRKERRMEREAAALRILLTDIMAQLDRAAYVKSCGADVGMGMKHLKAICVVFGGLDSQLREMYYEMACEAFVNAKVPAFAYQGVSTRLKKRMQRKVREQLEAEIAAEEAKLKTTEKALTQTEPVSS